MSQLQYRENQAYPLTFEEMDGNLNWLSANMSASNVVISASKIHVKGEFVDTLFATSSQALTASYISGNIELHGVNIITGSFVVTGSNVITGSLLITGSSYIVGSVTISSSNTFTNIGPTILSGSLRQGLAHTLIASGPFSHAEGISTTAKSTGSHAEGLGTIASKDYQHVEGQYNAEDTNALWILGDGEPTRRKNLITAYSGSGGLVYINGNLLISGSVNGVNLNNNNALVSSLEVGGPFSNAPGNWRIIPSASVLLVQFYSSSLWYTDTVFEGNIFNESVGNTSGGNSILNYAVTSSYAATASYVSGAVLNQPDPFISTPIVNRMITLTTAEFNAITVKDPSTYYIVM